MTQRNPAGHRTASWLFASRKRKSQRHQRERPSPSRCTPQLEELETRLMLATVVLTPSKDNTIYQPSGSGGQLSNARGWLFAGKNGENGGALIRRALMHFDLSTIPSGSTITNVSLEMFVSRAASAAGEPATLHRVTADWGEGTSLADERGGGQGASATTGDATWQHRFFSSATWSSPGGDFGSASATTDVGANNTRPVWSSAGMISDVQAWQASPSTNFGWMLRVREGNEAQCCTAKRFHSRENTNAPKLTVTFTDPASLAVNIAADSISEGAGAGATTATVTRTGSTSGSLVVGLASSDTSEATVQTSVVIPAGQATSPAVNIDAVDDELVDGTQTVTLTASASGLADATDNVNVTDDDVSTLTLTIGADAISEAAGPTATTATVSRNTSTTNALVVNLSSSDSSEATVPATVTIAAGQTTSPAFNVAAIDDDIVDGTQTVTLTAASSGFVDGTDTVDVTDDDVLPTVTDQFVNGEGNTNRSRVLNLALAFDQAVTVVGPTSLKLFNHTAGQQIDISAATLQNNGSTEVIWDLSNVNLPSGQYTAELLPAGAASTVGANPLEQSHTFAFHLQPGDGSGDRSVDFVDFGQLSANFGQTVGPLGPGDLDGNATVNFTDFGLLSSNFGAALAALALDFGDAPAGSSYLTTLAENGARHVVGGLYLGAGVDAEADGQPSVNAAADDDAGDDEDGVSFAAIQVNSTANLTVTASAVGVLSAWIDFNINGDWDDPGEQVLVDQALTAGANNLTFSVPAGATVGATFARFRLTSSGGYTHRGLAPDGEVEDYAVTVTAPSSAPRFATWPSWRASTTLAINSGTQSTPLAARKPLSQFFAPVPAVVDRALSELEPRGVRGTADDHVPLDEYVVDAVLGEEFL